MTRFGRWFLLVLCCCSLCQYFSPSASAERGYKSFEVAVYVPEYVVEQMKDSNYLQSTWKIINDQVKVDKVYLETYRSGRVADDQLLDQVKKFFVDRGVEVAGGIGLTVMESNNFQSFCYTDPKDRDFVKMLAQKTARHFDEIILDDFYFNNTKYDSDIAAKGSKSWAEFRLGLMDQVSRELIVDPAKAVNSKVKVIIKFPNWYEHFQGNGYDLKNEPGIFDEIWTGNETREADMTPQHLQQYQSYEIFRYFENISPGRNGGGWVDTGGIRYVDRYAEQLWDTMLAKAPSIMLFKWTELLNPAVAGQRQAWSDIHTSFDYQQLVNEYEKSHPGLHSTMAGVAGYALGGIDPVIGRLGNPIGIASYKPYNSSGEDFLQNYFGMMGIPIEMYPSFPADAKVVLLTQEAADDPQIVSKIKARLEAGKDVFITSGLVQALQDKGLGDLLSLRYTSRKAIVDQFAAGYGAPVEAGNKNGGILIPEIDFFTNDAVPLIRAGANGNSFPILLSDHYSKGVIYVLTIPDNFNDLYSYPSGIVSVLRENLLRDFPVRLDGPDKVSLFAYDNHTFVVESYLDQPVAVTVALTGGTTKITNMQTGDVTTGSASTPRRGFGGRIINTGPDRVNFQITIQPHSYAAFSETP
ncbi:hypothetical protein [Paracidobacterium acidisoli]|nr:hypothetical protein [Paracidobacterium acidisoli]MBT9332976.1 hypothetical protein [Paracidobacterium acidisoli]